MARRRGDSFGGESGGRCRERCCEYVWAPYATTSLLEVEAWELFEEVIVIGFVYKDAVSTWTVRILIGFVKLCGHCCV